MSGSLPDIQGLGNAHYIKAPNKYLLTYIDEQMNELSDFKTGKTLLSETESIEST